MSVLAFGTDKHGKQKWRIDYYPNGSKGKRVQEIFKGTEAEARRYEIQVRRQVPKTILSNTPKIADVIPEYLQWLSVHRKPRTLEDYKQSLNFLIPKFGHLPVHRISPAIVDDYKAFRLGKPRATNKELVYLKRIISWMVERSYANPLSFRIYGVPHKAKLPHIPHPAEIEKFIKEVTNPLKKAMVLLMFQCGLRWKDASLLAWENINWQSNEIIIRESKTGERLAILTPEIKRLLKPYAKVEGYVFINPRTGKPYKSLKTLFMLASRRAGVTRFYPHLLRHASATYMLEATGDLRTVQEHLDHKSIQSTQIYTHISTARKKLASRKMREYLQKIRG